MHKCLYFIALVGCFSATAQFPDTWIRSYEGTMHLSNNSGVYDSVIVQFEMQEVEKNRRWSYKMTYKSERFGDTHKAYEIVRDSTGYVMDEKNGLRIEMAYMNDVFYEFFEVGNIYYACTMRKLDSGILFEIFGAGTKPTLSTRSLPEEDGTIYSVESRKPQFAQTVLLIPHH